MMRLIFELLLYFLQVFLPYCCAASHLHRLDSISVCQGKYSLRKVKQRAKRKSLQIIKNNYSLLIFFFLAHLSRRLEGELLVYPWSGVRPSSVVHNFKHEYLCIQWADHNEILSEASLGWGKGCRRFWTRLDQNSGFHGNR